jgi:hypothetical protein
VQITCDGWTPYVPAIEKYLTYRANLAILVKQYGTQGADINTIDPIRRYSAPNAQGLRLKSALASRTLTRFAQATLERINLSVRHFNKRFGRLGLGFSRKLANHHHAIALFVVAYNFCKRHSTLGTTPAVASRLADHCWSVAELVKRLSETI